MNLGKLLDIVKDRDAWCAADHGVTNSWTQLSNWTTGSVVPEEPAASFCRGSGPSRVDWTPFWRLTSYLNPHVLCYMGSPELLIWTSTKKKKILLRWTFYPMEGACGASVKLRDIQGSFSSVFLHLVACGWPSGSQTGKASFRIHWHTAAGPEYLPPSLKNTGWKIPVINHLHFTHCSVAWDTHCKLL